MDDFITSLLELVRNTLKKDVIRSTIRDITKIEQNMKLIELELASLKKTKQTSMYDICLSDLSDEKIFKLESELDMSIDDIAELCGGEDKIIGSILIEKSN